MKELEISLSPPPGVYLFNLFGITQLGCLLGSFLGTVGVDELIRAFSFSSSLSSFLFYSSPSL